MKQASRGFRTAVCANGFPLANQCLRRCPRRCLRRRRGYRLRGDLLPGAARGDCVCAVPLDARTPRRCFAPVDNSLRPPGSSIHALVDSLDLIDAADVIDAALKNCGVDEGVCGRGRTLAAKRDVKQSESEGGSNLCWMK